MTHRVRTIIPKSGPLLEISTSDKTGMVRIQVVEDESSKNKPHVIEAFFGSILGELNSAESATPSIGLPLGRCAKILNDRGWAVIGSRTADQYAVLLFRTEHGPPVACDVPIHSLCRLVEHVATGAHHEIIAHP